MSQTTSFHALREHNRLRAKHENTPSMETDPELTKQAQAWAEKCAKSGKMAHAPENECLIDGKLCGENIASSTGRFKWGDQAKAAIWAVNVWYREIQNYDFEKGIPNGNKHVAGGQIGHFTQVVWDESVKLGMGVAFNGNKVYVVGRYLKHGNMRGGYLDHVHRRKEEKSSEKKKSVSKKSVSKKSDSKKSASKKSASKKSVSKKPPPSGPQKKWVNPRRNKMSRYRSKSNVRCSKTIKPKIRTSWWSRYRRPTSKKSKKSLSKGSMRSKSKTSTKSKSESKKKSEDTKTKSDCAKKACDEKEKAAQCQSQKIEIIGPEKTICIYSSMVVNGIEINGTLFGKKHGYKKCIKIADGDYIKFATWKQTKYAGSDAISQLRLHTAKGRQYSLFGRLHFGFQKGRIFKPNEFHKNISVVNGRITEIKGARNPRKAKKN